MYYTYIKHKQIPFVFEKKENSQRKLNEVGGVWVVAVVF